MLRRKDHKIKVDEKIAKETNQPVGSKLIRGVRCNKCGTFYEKAASLTVCNACGYKASRIKPHEQKKLDKSMRRGQFRNG